MVIRSSAPERQMKNLTGSPDIATKDGRMAIWVATREYITLVPIRGREFFYSDVCGCTKITAIWVVPRG